MSPKAYADGKGEWINSCDVPQFWLDISELSGV